jgi:GrpB-like predicted nucleotidyltransferase (UPF0157 family)
MICSSLFLVDFNNLKWQQLFREECDRLWDYIGELILEVEQINSKSFSNLVATPIINISIIVADLEAVTRSIRPLKQLGYTYLGNDGLPGTHVFCKGKPRTYNIYMNERRCK